MRPRPGSSTGAFVSSAKILVDDLMSRSRSCTGRKCEAARPTQSASVGDWVLRFNAHGESGLVGRKAPGQPSLLKNEHRAALMRMIEDGPTPAIHGVVRWRIVDLCQRMFEEFRIAVSDTAMSRPVARHGLYRKLSARPYAQAEGVIEDFKKASPPAWRKSRAKKGVHASDIEIWFADEGRIGQKNKLTRRWAKHGSRLSAPKDQRTSSTYIFGAILPKDGKGAALVLPKCDTYAMNLLI